MDWIDGVNAFTRLPTVLVAPMGSTDERRGALRELAAAALRQPLAAIAIVHERDTAARLVRPAESGLHLSSASRAGLAVLAVARQPIGVDVEAVTPAEPPWHVLHLAEQEALKGLGKAARSLALARLWSLKEAYLKALGAGLSRAPESFAVRFGENGEAEIDDPVEGLPVERVATRMIDGSAVVSVVILGRFRRP